MLETDQQQIAIEAAREAIAQVAPQELPLIPPISQAYFKEPKAAARSRGGKDEMLGFGEAAGIQLLTPVALAMASQVVTFLVAEVRKSVKAESPGLINDLVKSFFKKLRPSDQSETKKDDEVDGAGMLTPEQLAKVREIAIEKARELGLTGRKAELLADSMVGGLAVAE